MASNPPPDGGGGNPREQDIEEMSFPNLRPAQQDDGNAFFGRPPEPDREAMAMDVDEPEHQVNYLAIDWLEEPPQFGPPMPPPPQPMPQQAYQGSGYVSEASTGISSYSSRGSSPDRASQDREGEGDAMQIDNLSDEEAERLAGELAWANMQFELRDGRARPAYDQPETFRMRKQKDIPIPDSLIHLPDYSFKRGGDTVVSKACGNFGSVHMQHFIKSILDGIATVREESSYENFVDCLISCLERHYKSKPQRSGHEEGTTVVGLRKGADGKRGLVPLQFAGAQELYDYVFVILGAQVFDSIHDRLEELGFSPGRIRPTDLQRVEPPKLIMQTFTVPGRNKPWITWNGSQLSGVLTLMAYKPRLNYAPCQLPQKNGFVLLIKEKEKNGGEKIVIGIGLVVKIEKESKELYSRAEVRSDWYNRPVIYHQPEGSPPSPQLENWTVAERFRMDVRLQIVPNSLANRNGPESWLINYDAEEMPRPHRAARDADAPSAPFDATKFMFPQHCRVFVYPLEYIGNRIHRLAAAYLIRLRHSPDKHLLLQPRADHFRPAPDHGSAKQDGDFDAIMALIKDHLPNGFTFNDEQLAIIKALHRNLTSHKAEKVSPRLYHINWKTRCLFVQGPAGTGKTALFAVMVCFAIMWALRLSREEDTDRVLQQLQNNWKAAPHYSEGRIGGVRSRNIKVVFACGTNRAANQMIIAMRNLGLETLLLKQAKEFGLVYNEPEINYPMVRLGHECDIRSTVVFQYTPRALAAAYYHKTGKLLEFHSSMLAEDCMLTTSTLDHLNRDSDCASFMDDDPESAELAEVLMLMSDEVGVVPFYELAQLFQFRSSVLVFGGDKEQLHASNISNFELRCNVNHSLFELVDGIRDGNNDPSQLYLWLKTQYRMHPEVGHFPNHFFYKGKMVNAFAGDHQRFDGWHRVLYFNLIHSKEAKIPKNLTAKDKKALGLGIIPTLLPGQTPTYINVDEYTLVGHLARLLLLEFGHQYPDEDERSQDPDKLARKAEEVYRKGRLSLGVITFYKGQRDQLHYSLRASLGPKFYQSLVTAGVLTVATIDSCQGIEFTAAIVSFVRAPPHGEPNAVGFLQEKRRLCAILTRGSQICLYVGDASNFAGVRPERAHHFHRLGSQAIQSGHLVLVRYDHGYTDDDLYRALTRFNFHNYGPLVDVVHVTNVQQQHFPVRKITNALVTVYKNRLNFHVADKQQLGQLEQSARYDGNGEERDGDQQLPRFLSALDLYGFLDSRGLIFRVRMLPRIASSTDILSLSDTVAIRCVDTGHRITTRLAQLRRLPVELRNIPILAIHCCFCLDKPEEYRERFDGNPLHQGALFDVVLVPDDYFGTGTERSLSPEKHIWPIFMHHTLQALQSRMLIGRALRVHFGQFYDSEPISILKWSVNMKKWYELVGTRIQDQPGGQGRAQAARDIQSYNPIWGHHSGPYNADDMHLYFLRAFFMAQCDGAIGLMLNMSEHYVESGEFVPKAFELMQPIAFRFGSLFLRGLLIGPSSAPIYTCLAIDLGLLVEVNHADIRHLNPMFNVHQINPFVPGRGPSGVNDA